MEQEKVPATAAGKQAARPSKKKQQSEKNSDSAERPWQQIKPALRAVPEERLKEIEAQIAAFAADETRTEPLAFPATLPAHERKVVHRVAEEYNLSHESFGLGKQRHIQVSKQPDVKERTLETLSISMKRRFVKDFEIPIKCFDPDDFRYFLDLYDAEMQTHAKLNMMLDEIKAQGGEAAFHRFYFGTKEKIVQDLSSSEALVRFGQDNSFAPDYERLPSSIYDPKNGGKYYLSLDIRSANFNALRFYNSSLVHGYATWEELLREHFGVTSPYLLATKELRSVVFHELCPTQVNALNHWRMQRLYDYLRERGHLARTQRGGDENGELLQCYNNHDEILIEVETADELRQLEVVVRAAITEEIEKQKQGNEHPLLKALPDVLRIQCFRLCGLPNRTTGFRHLANRMFIKELLDFTYSEGSSAESSPVVGVEFKGVPLSHFAMCWKTYRGEEVTERDLKFWNEFADNYQQLVLSTTP